MPAGICLKSRRAAAFCAALAASIAHPVWAAEPVMHRGDAAVTGFSGTIRPGSSPRSGHPADSTLINTATPSLNVLDLSGAPGEARGQLVAAPIRHRVPARDIGQVFGVAIDSVKAGQPPNIYAGATSLYGLNIVKVKPDGTLERLVRGAPEARWMTGQFGLDKGGGPGSVWKIDGTTGAVSLFSTITSGNLENAGPGLGGIAFDPRSQQLYVASLETGLVHRLDISGREIETFDHGLQARPKADLDPAADDPARRMDILSPAFDSEIPETWGYAANARLVIALAVANERLYYTVAEGPSVWSVGLRSDGSFGTDPRRELEVQGTPRDAWITALALDGRGTLYLSQRGERTGAYDYATFARPQSAVVWRYTWDDRAKTWSEAAKEYAVGLGAPHRATNGGLALSYGYSKEGKPDYDRCRATLWTTGEHLKPAASRDGPRPVHGLQGNAVTDAQDSSITRPRTGSEALSADYGTIAESNLEEPENAWFADGDGVLDRPDAHGHMGSVAIFAPCAGEAEPAAERPDPPAVPPPATPRPERPVAGILIDKVCAPGLIGSKISCRITVTNTGLTSPADVLVSDVSTFLAGPAAGAPVTINAVVPDGPGWWCTPVPSESLQCLLPGTVLGPGVSRFFDAVIDTGPLAPASHAGFRNCARLEAPHAGEACAEGLAPAGGLVIVKTGPAVCNPGTNCTFSLSIKNESVVPYAGGAHISDSMFVGGFSVAAPIVASNLDCAGGNPAALPFDCVVPAVLAPGATKSYSVTVTMPAAPANYWAQNCFAAFDPGFAPAGGPLPVPGGALGAAFGSPANPACHWVKAGAPAPQANLALVKSAQGGMCLSSFGTGVATCRYAITISNGGPSDYNGPVSISEVTPAGSNLVLDPNWPCVAAAPGFTCTSPAAVAIPSGGAIVVKAEIEIPALLTEPTCKVKNEAAIAAPLGAPWNMLAADDASIATQSTALLAVLNPDGTVTVTCDPTNLETVKSVEQCTDAGNSLSCRYRITVKNTGPDPYTGPITVADQLSAAPSSLSLPADWSCGAAGQGFLCTKASVTLSPPGAGPGPSEIAFTVTASLPKAGKCVVRNTAHMTFPLAGTRFNGRGDDDQSTVATPVDEPRCREVPRCERPSGGEVVTASGACACAEGLVRDRKGRCTPARAEAPAVCPDGSLISQNGFCPCPRAERWSRETGRCEALCVPGLNEYRTSAGQCVCKTGYARRDGQCVRGGKDDEDASTPPPVESCDPGPNGYRTKAGRCLCDKGYERVDGTCSKITVDERCTPGPNEMRSRQGACICKDGYTRVKGQCVREEEPEPAPVCKPGPNEVLTQDGRCVCREGFERSVKGLCVRESTEPPKVCPEGTTGRYPNCVKIPKSCPSGTTGRYPDCKPVKPDEPSPAAECKARGGRWVSGTCIMPPPPQKVCPPGTRGTPPRCVKIETPKTCPKGTRGTYPNCKPVVIDKPPGKLVPPKIEPKSGPKLQKSSDAQPSVVTARVSKGGATRR